MITLAIVASVIITSVVMALSHYLIGHDNTRNIDIPVRWISQAMVTDIFLIRAERILGNVEYLQ